MLTLEEWLRSFGFTRNPFETTEAVGESLYAAEFLNGTFVKPECFDRILGQADHPKSMLVFAPRGCGKSSTCLMTAHFCREGISPSETHDLAEIPRVLPIMHTKFSYLSKSGDNSISLVDAHVIEILQRGVKALAEMIHDYPDVAGRVQKMDDYSRLELQSFFVRYQDFVPISDFYRVRKFLGGEIRLGGEADPDRLIGMISNSAASDNPDFASGEIIDQINLRFKSPLIDQLARFAALSSQLGIRMIDVLIDGLDESWLTADNPEKAVGLIAPLLSNLTLMNSTPFLTFKVFAPAELSDLLLKVVHQVRRDRIGIENIIWNETSLLEILERRLAYCSNDTVMSLDAISAPEIRGQIDHEIVHLSGGNPRRLILMGDYIFRARCLKALPESGRETYLLTRVDIDEAVRKLDIDLPPAVISRPDISFIGAEEQSISIPAMPKLHDEVSARIDLPSPLARAYLYYAREPLPPNKVWKLYDLVEASAAYLSLTLIAMIRSQLGDGVAAQLKRSNLRFERASLGLWRIALESLPGILGGLGVRDVFARGVQRLATEHRDFLIKINDQRNRLAHDGPQSEETCNGIVADFNQPLENFMQSLRFICQPYLVKVQKITRHGDEFTHRCIWYCSDAMVFPTVDLLLKTPLEAEKLWFVEGLKTIDLHPLMIVLPGPENLGDELWLYQGISDQGVVYKNYGTGRVQNITDKPCIDAINEILGG